MESKNLILLAIETSCDDSSMAIIRNGEILTNIIYNQEIHRKYGGVIPEWASSKHLEAMVSLYKETLEKANIEQVELHGIVVTRGPGLMGSLLVGMGFAKALALALDIPLIEVNHLEAHLCSVLIDLPKPTFPFLCLTVSGGHTQLIRVNGIGDYHILGGTLDDAAGEAFDKTGKMLGLDYPAGPIIDQLAQKGIARFKFPISVLDGYQYSFSGFKTAVLYFLQKEIKNNPDFISENLEDLCASIQHTIVEILIKKVTLAMKNEGLTELGIAGGVSANSGLRKRIAQICKDNEWKSYFPAMQYCTDNAAMIAFVGYQKYLASQFADENIMPLPRMPVSS
ncbi:MAG: tRNA (adenosine(37)-N6)-threonylcarbamoyltransferase complex transferase subunit TsaD [Saprospiraceae bacterium]|nr:tRNA (adenosine(37)-N6)-threonylcarbamoyltransferase complex transferase subunit TsaD [Saprospiraceae bacterium]